MHHCKLLLFSTRHFWHDPDSEPPRTNTICLDGPRRGNHDKVFFWAAASVAIAAATAPAQAQNRYLGDIFIAGYGFCPRGTTSAEGQLVAISSNTALYSIYSTTYGGDGRTNFQLPDMRSRGPIGQGPGPGLTNYPQGARGGAETITLTTNNLPAHSHNGRVRATTGGPTTNNPADATFPTFPAGTNMYSNGNDNTPMHDDDVQISPAGNGQAFNNRNPFLSLRYCVVLQGIFPPRN